MHNLTGKVQEEKKCLIAVSSDLLGKISQSNGVLFAGFCSSYWLAAAAKLLEGPIYMEYNANDPSWNLQWGLVRDCCCVFSLMHYSSPCL